MCLENSSGSFRIPTRPPNIDSLQSEASTKALPNSWNHVETGPDWVVIDKGHTAPTDAQLAEFEKEMLTYMPKELRDGRIEPRKPWKGQVIALYKLCRDKVDTILSARTGYGKSIIYQLAPFLCPGNSKALIISPLIALSNDQESALKQFGEFGAKGLVIKGENNNAVTRRQAIKANISHSMFS